MTRGSDQRIELELALFSLSEPPQQMQAVPVQAVPARAAAQPAVVQPFASAPAAQPFASAPARPAPAAEPTPAQPQEAVPVQSAVPAASVPQTVEPEQAEISPAPAEETLPLPEEPPVQQTETPLPWEEPPASVEQPAAPESVQQPSVPLVQEKTAGPVPGKSDKTVQEGIAPFPYWEQVVQQLQEKDPMLYTYLRKSKAYFDGTRVLIDGGKTFRDFIRANRDSQRLIKKLIANVSGVAVPIGPYEPKTAGKAVSNAEQSLRALEKLGLDVSIEDSARKKRS